MAETAKRPARSALAEGAIRWKRDPPTSADLLRAIELQRAAGLPGHKYAINAVVAATAPQSAKPVAIATSDADDMQKLCGKSVRVIAV